MPIVKLDLLYVRVMIEVYYYNYVDPNSGMILEIFSLEDIGVTFMELLPTVCSRLFSFILLSVRQSLAWNSRIYQMSINKRKF